MDERYESFEALKADVQQHAREQGYAITTKRLKKTLGGKTTRGRGASRTSSNAGQRRRSHQTTYTEQRGRGGAGQ